MRVLEELMCIGRHTVLNWRPDGIILDSDTIYSIVHSLGVISLFLLCCVGPPLKVIGGKTIREDMVDIDSLTHWTIYTSPHFRNRSGDLRWMCDSLIYIYLSIRCGIFSSTLLLCQRKKREPKVNIKATGLHNSVVCILFVS